MLRQVYALARPSGRRRLVTVLAILIAQALMQTLAVFSLIPFLGAAADMGRFRASRLGRVLVDVLGGGSDARILLWAGAGALFLLITGNLVALGADYVRGRYANAIGQRLRHELLRKVLERRYDYFLGINTSVLLKHVVEDVSHVASSVISPTLDLLARLVLATLLIGTALFIEPWVVLGGAVLLVVYYFAVMQPIRRQAAQSSDRLKEEIRAVYFEVYQILTGIKPILAVGRRSYFLRRVEDVSRRLTRYTTITPMYPAIPRTGLEILVFGGMIVWVLAAIIAGGNLVTLIPRVGLIAVIAYRLMPSVQAVFAQLGAITAARQSLDEITDVLAEQDKFASGESAGADAEEVQPLHWSGQITFEDVAYRYPGADAPALEGMRFTIDKGSRVAIVGPTGSGKSTMIDLLLGLHRPTSGRILIDGQPLTSEQMGSWKRAVGYVPQDLFLLDGTMAENVAFGFGPDELDGARVDEVAELAQARDFIDRTDMTGVAAGVGERGVRLSGGQRQRLALARALYARPNILVMDEATSALDPKTEQRVVSAMMEGHEQLTIVTVTHRLSTVKDYDCIHFLEHGRIVASGDFASLLANHASFREFAA